MTDALRFALAALFAGSVSGFLAGLFGVGGANVLVLALYELFRVFEIPDSIRMQTCIGTSLAILGPTSLRTYLAYRAHGVAASGVLRAWTVPVLAGVACACIAAFFTPAAMFKLIYLAFLIVMAAQPMLERGLARLRAKPNYAITAGFGFLVGVVSALTGTGGAVLTTFFLTICGQSVYGVAASSAGVGALIGVPGAIGFAVAGLQQQALMPPFSIGYVSLIGAALILPASVLAAIYGTAMAQNMPRRGLEIAFAIFVVSAAIRLLWNS